MFFIPARPLSLLFYYHLLSVDDVNAPPRRRQFLSVETEDPFSRRLFPCGDVAYPVVSLHS